ncbi:hypothetical protein F2P81_012149 [Scophthalmus maximus]|uniref:FAM65 N-terminal domain-containing protein n=1 Tax=Scophthalmus maximus TaxID=52904 RepID=A0A6A4STM8_SCOMX|nr:hypothetical protein F2P81_012149 [Scophthalmus maximus]
MLGRQVTEAKGLGWLLVGMVTCASADFFVARSQLMLVDVTELGTIKLQLEVTWKYGRAHARTHTHTKDVNVPLNACYDANVAGEVVGSKAFVRREGQ